MNCHKVRIQLRDYLDHQLSARQRAKLEQHLDVCPDCRAELAFIKTYRSTLAAMPPQAAPPDLLANVRHRLSLGEESTPQKGLRKVNRSLPVFLPGLAGTALLAVLVVWLAKPWEFGLNPVPGNQPVASIVAPAPTADQSAESLSKKAPAGRTDVSKSVAPKSRAESSLQLTSKSASESASKPGSESAPKFESESEPILKSGSGSTAKSKSMVAVASTADQSGEKLLKSIIAPRKGPIWPEAVVTVAIPIEKTALTRSHIAEPDGEEGVAAMVMSRLQNLLKSIDGVIVREETTDRRELPLRISITISPANYPRLIAGLKELGEVSEPSLEQDPDQGDLRLKLEINNQIGLK